MDLIKLFFFNFYDIFIDMAFYILLGLLFVGLLNTFIKKEKIIKHLGDNKFSSVLKSAIIGVPLPLCSCGVVPTAIELKKSGASNGAVVSFLISTPQTGVDSIFATYSLMGIIMAIFRPLAAFLSGVFGGAFVNTFAKNENIVTLNESNTCCHSQIQEEQVSEVTSCCCNCNTESDYKKTNKFYNIFKYAYIDFLKDISIHFAIGILLATVITTFVPADFFVDLGISNGILAMISMVLIGLPMYICSTSSIPIAMSLITKGLSFGAGFVFLFTGPVTNIASLIVLKKVLGKKITIIYISIVIFFSIAFGFLLDFLIYTFNIDIMSTIENSSHSFIPYELKTVCGIIFAILLIIGIINQIKNKFNIKNNLVN